MFKFKDKTYSLEDVQLAAEDSNLSLDDYIVKVGIETDEDNSVKTNGVAETDASVTPEPNTASTLDPGSSVSTDPKNKRNRYFICAGSGFTDEGEMLLSDKISGDVLTQLGVDEKVVLPVSHGMKKYLKRHREIFHQ